MAPTKNPESASDLQLVLTRTFDAPRDLVWQAWTRAEQIAQWFRPKAELTPRSAKADVRVGGRYRIQIQHPDGEFYTAAGTYREVKAPEWLVFTWAWEKDGSGDDFGEVDEQNTLITLEFRARGKQTEMLFKQENFLTVESRDRHQEGWGGCFDQLAEFLKGR